MMRSGNNAVILLRHTHKSFSVCLGYLESIDYIITKNLEVVMIEVSMWRIHHGEKS